MSFWSVAKLILWLRPLPDRVAAAGAACAFREVAVDASRPVVVIGGGIAGLGTALGLGRSGRQVVVLDRDPLTAAAEPDGAFGVERQGAPQARHTHGLLARLSTVLRERFPDVLESLVAAGGVEVDLARRFADDRPGDGDLRVLLARRTTLEWALRRAAARQPGLTLLGGEAVTSLVGAGATGARGPSAVSGVRLASGAVLEASLVVAAGGRRAPVTSWLAELAIDLPEEEHQTGIVYLTRWYRSPGWDQVIGGEDLIKLGGDLGYLFYLAVPADRGTFSVTMAIDAADRPLRARLLHPSAFDRAARALPLPPGLVERLVPDGPVHPIGGLVNRIRRFADSAGRPIVTGFHAVGDAHTCTNPIYGRGCSLALVQAVALTDAVVAHPADPVGRAVAYEAACRASTEPWYDLSLATDRARQARRRADAGDGSGPSRADGSDQNDRSGSACVAGRHAGQQGRPGPEGGETTGVLDQLLQLGSDDPVVGRAILRAVNLLTTPKELLNDAAVLTRVMELVAARVEGAGPTANRWTRSGPTRTELFELIAA
jgi:2-polyprenyl-6-methoxyphenol hydroxylase-like FAD-dependent oxidoreductase